MKSNLKKKVIEQREDVLKSLPEFVNMLILFLGSGSNVEDSMKKVINSYNSIPIDKRGFFKNEAINILEESRKNGSSVVTLFYEFSRKSNMKELTRVSNILIDNKNKGVELWDRLKRESDELWQSRKRLVEGKIKTLDAKLAFPLSITLIALILIAAAPALLEIS